MSNMEDLEDLVNPEYDSEADAIDYYEDYDTGALYLYSKKMPGWKSETKLSYIPGQWNDSGVDPPYYSLSLEGYWVGFHFDYTSFNYPGKDGQNKYFKIDSVMKLSDFVTIVKSPFSLELSDGNMGKFYQDEYNRKDIVIEIDEEHVKKQIHRYVDLLAFS